MCVAGVRVCVCVCSRNTCLLSDERVPVCVCARVPGAILCVCVHVYTYVCSSVHICVLHVYTHVCSYQTRVCVPGEHMFVVR